MLFHNPTWPQFMRHYWLSFIWLLAATVTVGIFLITRDAFGSPMIFLPILGGVFRAIQGGWRPNKEVQRNEGCILVIIQFTVAVILWPFVEMFRQLRFLWHASRIWPQGRILVNEKDRPVRSA